MTQVLQDLIAARDLLVKDGWTKDHLRYGDAHCAVGAIIDSVTPGAIDGNGNASSELVLNSRVANALHALGKRLPQDGSSFHWGLLYGMPMEFARDWDAVVEFNNGTFENVVLDLFNNTIAALTPARELVPA